MKRLAIIVPDAGEGGLFQFYNQILPALAERVDVHVIFASPFVAGNVELKHEVTTHALDPADAAETRRKFGRGPVCPFPEIGQFLAVAEHAWQYAKRLNADIVELCDWPLGFVPAAGDGSQPHVVQCHGSAGQIAGHDAGQAAAVSTTVLRLLESQAMADACSIQTYSSSNAAFWQRATRRQVKVILPAYRVGNEPTYSGEGDDAVVFGRLQSWKGPDVLCAALRQMGSSAPNCHWYGSVKPWPQSKLDAAGHLASEFPDVWNHKFIHHRAVERHEVARLQAQAKFVVVPSEWDVFNFTAVEAMARGVPVIVSTGAGASELIEPGVNGLTFTAGDHAALAACIDTLNRMTRQQRRDMGMAGRETVASTLNPERIAAQRLAAYHEAVALHKASPVSAPHPWLKDLLFAPPAQANCSIQDFAGTLPARALAGALIDRAKSFRWARRWS